MTVDQFHELLDDIAALNGDEFFCFFMYNRKAKMFRWAVHVEETADSHTLTSGVGDTPEDACRDAAKGLRGIVETLWGYKWPEKWNDPDA